jgi:hypothetical protein
MMVICWGPAVRAGVTTRRVLASLKVTVADFPLMEIIDGNCGGALEAAATDGESGATGRGNSGRNDGADSQRYGGELDDGESSVCAVPSEEVMAKRR